MEVSWRRLVWSEDKRAVNKEENFRIVYLSYLCVTADLLFVASWVATHVHDEKYCERTLQHQQLIRSHFDHAL